MNEFKMLTVNELKDSLSIGRDKAYRLMRSHAFPSIKIGGTYYVSASKLESWLERNAGKEFYL